MGDEGVKMDNLKVAPPLKDKVDMATLRERKLKEKKEEKRREKKELKERREKGREKQQVTSDSSDSDVKQQQAQPKSHPHPHPHSDEAGPPQSSFSKAIRFLALLTLIPAMYFVPYILRYAGGQVKENFNFLIYLWAVYALILLAIFFLFKKKTITLDSFVTQIMGWMIITLGIYHLVDLPKMVDISLRKDVLYVWCSFTMIFNIIYFFLDTRDYQEEQRKENEKEERRKKKDEARKEKEAEKRKQRLDNMMSPGKRKLVNTLIYLAFAGFLVWLVNWFYHYNLQFQEEIAIKHGTMPTNEPTYTYD